MKMTREELKSMVTETARQAVQEELKSGKHEGAEHENVQRKYASVYLAQPHDSEPAHKSLPAGIGLARSIKCAYLAGGKDPERAAWVAHKMYDDGNLEHEFKAMTATMPSDGGILIPEAYVNEVIPLLRAKSVVQMLGARTIPMENGNLTIPRQTEASTAGYVGELRSPKKSNPRYGALKLSAKKLVGIVEISNDLLRSASLDADALVRDDAITTMALAQDRAALMGKGTEFEPRGVLENADVQKIAVNGAVTKTLVGEMLAKLVAANVDIQKLGWAFNGQVWSALYNFTDAQDRFIFRDALDKGQLNGHTVGVSNQLPADGGNKTSSIILGDWSQLLIGEQTSMQVDVFDQAALVDSGDVLSAMSRDTTFLRLLSIHDIGLRQPSAFVVATGVKTVS